MLESLRVSDSDTDIVKIATLSKLRVLRVPYAPLENPLEHLAELTLRDVSYDLPYMPTLIALGLHRDEDDRDTDPEVNTYMLARSTPNLKFLDVSRRQFEMMPLVDLKSLRQLYARNADFDVDQLEYLACLTDLELIDISNSDPPEWTPDNVTIVCDAHCCGYCCRTHEFCAVFDSE
jgi:hypothetical protein